MMIMSPVFSGEPDKKLHEKCIYPTVMITNANGSGSSTGTIIRSEKMKDGKYHNVAITTAHGLINKVMVTLPNYENWSEIGEVIRYPAVLYYTNKKVDLAVVIFVSEKHLYTADFGFKEKIYIGNKILRVGCGLGDAPRLEEGVITGVNMPSIANTMVYRMSIYTLPGDSGGSVYNEDYLIIGFTQSIRSDHFANGLKYYNYTMAVRIASLEEMIKTEKGGLDFIKEGNLPTFGYFKLKIDFLTQDQRAIPASIWIDS